MDRWSAYPWHAIERVQPHFVNSLRSVRDALSDDWRQARVGQVLSELLGEPAQIIATRITAASSRPPIPNASACLFERFDSNDRVLVELEPAFAARAAARVLGRPTPLVDPQSRVPERIQAVVSALVLSVCRRISRQDHFRLIAVGPWAQAVLSETRSNAIQVELTVLLSEEVFQVDVQVDIAARPTRRTFRFDETSLTTLGAVPLRVQIVGALVLAEEHLVRAMEPGDAFVPGDGWLVQRTAQGWSGKPVLCPPRSSRGFPADLHDDGQIVVLGGSMSTTCDDKTDAEAPAIGEILGDATVVVRVELGSIEMSAREWASVRVGDVLATGHRIAERAVLRVAGREVAQGELVSIDGELAVRIQEISNGRNGGAL